MLNNQGHSSQNTLLLLILPVVIIAGLFIVQGNVGFSLSDEGYLWYGVQRVMLGEVPIRDFMSYDPGRYYWSATLMSVWDDNSMMALRGTVAVFQAIGLFVGLALIVRSNKKHDATFLIISAITLVVWMFPRHKLFDISVSILLIGALTLLIQRPTNRRYFLSGLCVGIIAIFGRNHGIYGVVGSLGVMAWLSVNRAEEVGFSKGFVSCLSGVAVGFSPVLFMVLFVPGFAAAYWESIHFLFEIKTTNLPLPVPWPWRVDFSSVSSSEAIRGVLIGLFFIGTFVFGVLSIAWVVLRKIQEKRVAPPLVAAAFLALPYAHFAFSRADVSHLAQGIFPLLIGCLVILVDHPVKFKLPLALLLCGISIWVMHIFHPGWQCYSSERCVSVEVSGNDLVVGSGTARNIALLRRLANQYAPDGQNVIVTPYWPGAYPLLGRKSPMWETYALFPRSRVHELEEIQRIKTAKPSFALVSDRPLDGRDELRFRNTHPLTFQYIRNNYNLLHNSPDPAHQIYIAKESIE